MKSWVSLVTKLINLLKRIGAGALVGMMVVTCVDVIFRGFNRPIFGAVEVVSFMATIVLACAMPLTEFENGHVGVDLFIRRLSARAQARWDACTKLFSGVLFGLVCWQMWLYGNTVKATGEVSMSLQFPDYILIYIVSVAFGVLGLVILTESLVNLRKAGAR
ncbi:MAG: TRAP transporter small permease [Desulfarculaceae bacterium]|nr:TRAP transporter small permease [Desulfarculaceae bacterium]MCF8047668.1 TRAP transporter small permease [Desulfarculaceae bacterium]MCF8065440.1 TRAP transporter small permease [Desulfarculaceae bacterium]MCF8097068.1 TRAP transporter small permease [Desulfarculaceae bacterium]MCF8121563.1 TRAP transporter small permease [Desulfarculaceae bacterium]